MLEENNNFERSKQKAKKYKKIHFSDEEYEDFYQDSKEEYYLKKRNATEAELYGTNNYNSIKRSDRYKKLKTDNE